LAGVPYFGPQRPPGFHLCAHHCTLGSCLVCDAGAWEVFGSALSSASKAAAVAAADDFDAELERLVAEQQSTTVTSAWVVVGSDGVGWGTQLLNPDSCPLPRALAGHHHDKEECGEHRAGFFFARGGCGGAGGWGRRREGEQDTACGERMCSSVVVVVCGGGAHILPGASQSHPTVVLCFSAP
jgi:hypothetical protein